MQNNLNRKIYIIAGVLWLVVIGAGVGFFMLGGFDFLQTDYVSLRSISMVSANEGWVGGVTSKRGQGDKLEEELLHYQNGKWQEYPSSFSKNFPGINALSMSSANEGWASGYTNIMLHYKDGKWSEVTSPLKDEIASIFTLAPNDVWAVAGGTVAHYNGSSWMTQTIGSNIGLRSIQMLSSHEGWAVGGSIILHYKDGNWRKDDSWKTNQPDPDFRAVSMFSPNDGIAVGEVFLADPQPIAGSYNNFTVEGIAYHYHNGVWAEDNNIDGTKYHDLSAAALVSPAEGWMIGTTSGHNISTSILHYKNGQWSEATKYNDLSDGAGLSMLSANEGWAVFGKHILHYQDGGWHE